jgi:hypothetical protein
MATRSQNEREFEHWINLLQGGRRYWFDRKRGAWGFQRIIKIVDADENALFVVQEIYNDDGELYERHQKFPVDTGHQILKRREIDEEGDKE